MPHAFLVTAAELPLYGLDEAFLDQFAPGVMDANLQAVTDEALGRMSPTVVPPLTAWGSDIKAACARIAVYELKSIAGLAPVQASVGDENLLLRAQAARAWLDSVGDGDVTPQGLVDSSADGGAASGSILSIESNTPREW